MEIIQPRTENYGLIQQLFECSGGIIFASYWITIHNTKVHISYQNIKIHLLLRNPLI